MKYDRTNKLIGFWRTNCTNLWIDLQDAYDNKGRPSKKPPPVTVVESSPVGLPVSAPAPEVSVEVGSIDGKY